MKTFKIWLGALLLLGLLEAPAALAGIGFVQAIPEFQSAPPTTSTSFTANAGDTIITNAVAFANGFTFSYSGTGTYAAVSGAYLNGTNASSGFGANTSATAGSQTITFTSSAGFQQGTGAEYSSVGSLSNGSAIERTAPGTGAGALLGNSVTVPTGSWLYVVVYQENGAAGAITNTAGTSRASSSSGVVYNIVDYVGTGAAIQPAFTVGTGTAGFILVQVILNPLAGSTSVFNQVAVAQWQTIIGNTTLSPAEPLLLCNATAGAVTATLPTAVNSFTTYRIQKSDSSANACTIATTSSQTIDGASTITLAAQNDHDTVVSDNINWHTVDLPIGPALAIPQGTATFAVGTSVTSVVCASGFLCNNTRGTLTIVGGSATTGTIATVSFSATLGVAPACYAWQNGGAVNYGIGNGAPSATAFTVTAAVSVASATLNVNYECFR
jgi:hypothetical protein